MRFEAVRILIGTHGAGLSWLWSMPRGGKNEKTGQFLCVVDTHQYHVSIIYIHCMINEIYISISLEKPKPSSSIEVFLTLCMEWKDAGKKLQTSTGNNPNKNLNELRASKNTFNKIKRKQKNSKKGTAYFGPAKII